jgi:hypothetical protein
MTNPEAEGQDTSPTITAPAEGALRDALEKKLDEYRRRLAPYGGEYSHPGKILFESFVLCGETGALDSILKHNLLFRVLTEGEISHQAFQSDVMGDELYQQSISNRPILFGNCLVNACQVISAYCDGRPQELGSGTGLDITSAR